MTTVACVWVQGHVPFTAEYVVRLEAMVARHLDRPYRFVCLTDRPWVFPGLFDTIPIQHDPALKGWWAKLRVFDRLLGLTGRILYLDLDTLIVASLAPIVDYPAPFALVPDGAPRFRPAGPLKVMKRFNSSVMVWDAGSADELWDTWTRKVPCRLWGDQDWIGEQWPDAAMMPAAWFPRLSMLTDGPPFDPDVKIILAKKPKNLQAAQQWPWFDALWRAA